MSKHRIAVIQFPGSNCERETALALKRSGMEPVDVFWTADVSSLDAYSGFVLVGGFSYEDRLSAGVIAALSPIMQGIKAQAAIGKPVLGICNGAQILVASGLVPNTQSGRVSCALHKNKRIEDGQMLRSTYYNNYADIKPMFVNKHHAFTNCFRADKVIRIPFAHAEGRFVISSALLDEMVESQSSMFQYQDGNPNGSDLSLAAISNKAGNVMAMMPHPERVEAGDIIFKSMKSYLDGGYAEFNDSKFQYSHELNKLNAYESDEKPLFVQLIIEDNTAKSLELVLKQQGINVSVSRYRYLGVQSEEGFDSIKSTLSNSTVLFNDAKEVLLPEINHGAARLVIEKDNQCVAVLNELLAMDEKTETINVTTQGLVYGFDGSKDNLEKLTQYLNQHHLLYNPFVEECYDY